MMSYMMLCTCDIMCLVHDILYDIFTDSARFKCGPGPVQMQPDLNQMQALLVPYVCASPWPSSPSSLTSLPRSSWLGSGLSDFRVSLYHSTSLRLMYQEYCASSTFFKTPTTATAARRAPQQGQ